MFRNTTRPSGGAHIPYNVFSNGGILPRFYFEPDGAGGGAGAGDGGAGGAGQGQGDGNTEAVEFTPAQQAKLQELINQAHGKAVSKGEQKAAARIAELEAEVAKLKGGDKGKGDKGQQGAGYDEEAVKKLIGDVRGEYEPKLSAALETVEKLKGHQRTSAIVSAAAKAKAVDPEVVSKLVGDAIGFDDDGRLVVLNANGQPMLNRKAEPMTVEEYVAQYLDERPYLKQAATAGGAGSSTTTGHQQTDTSKMRPADKIAAGLRAQKGQ